MALPPGWIGLYEAMLHLLARQVSRGDAIAIENRLKEHGWVIVPDYAVDKSKLVVDLEFKGEEL